MLYDFMLTINLKLKFRIRDDDHDRSNRCRRRNGNLFLVASLSHSLIVSFNFINLLNLMSWETSRPWCDYFTLLSVLSLSIAVFLACN